MRLSERRTWRVAFVLLLLGAALGSGEDEEYLSLLEDVDLRKILEERHVDTRTLLTRDQLITRIMKTESLDSSPKGAEHRLKVLYCSG
jgi:hypothetical protein